MRWCIARWWRPIFNCRCQVDREHVRRRAPTKARRPRYLKNRRRTPCATASRSVHNLSPGGSSAAGRPWLVGSPRVPLPGQNGCPLLGRVIVRAGARLFRFRQLPGWAPGGAIAPSPNRALVSRGARELPGAARRPRLLLPMDASSEKRVPGRHSCLLVCYRPLARVHCASKN